MNIRIRAEADLSFTLQDGVRGFGLPVIIEDASGHVIGNDVTAPFFCKIGRVHNVIDPDTGVAVEGAVAHITARMRDLLAIGFDVDGGCKDWKVTMPDINQQAGGKIRSYSVKLPRVSHSLGFVSLMLGELNRGDNSANEAIIDAIMGAISAA